jgi:aminocarboxymuconate-semialdehyde decarboxylase
MIAAAPARFKGLGAVPLQDPPAAAAILPRLRDDFGLSGVEIGSNINGVMLGDDRFDVFWQAAEDQGMAVFVHALHPVAVKSIEASPLFAAFVGFPIDVAMAAASLMTSGTFTRYPRLRIGFSHGGGALGSILGRLDKGWSSGGRYGIENMCKPSDQARRLFYDSNVYDPAYLRYLATRIAPGQVFIGTDYPYQIMQEAPVDFVAKVGLGDADLQRLLVGAAKTFLDC